MPSRWPNKSIPPRGSAANIEFSASQNGILTYLASGAGSVSQLTWFDRQGKALGSIWEPGNYQDLSLSPDGRRAAIHSVSGQNDLWLFEFSRNTSTRFTFDPVVDQEAIWSPDGSQIVWGSPRKLKQDLYRKASSGAGEEQVLLASGSAKVPNDWSPDGRFLLYATVTPKADSDLMVLPLNKDGFIAGSPSPFLATPFNESHGRFSPDGRWLAYTSDESGRSEVYVRPFPASSAGGKWQVSTDGGYQPLWRRDGRELLYFSPDSKLTSVEVSTSPAFKAATPKTLFAAPIYEGPVVSNTHRWDISPDGQRFLINVAPEAGAPITVVQNWQAGLKK